MDTVVRNRRLIPPNGVFSADVGIVGERIAALVEVGARLPGSHSAVELDATGCYVLPGGVDPHVHLQMPVGEYVSSDDFTSGTVAAAWGGTTAVIDFVEPEPEEPNVFDTWNAEGKFKGRFGVRYDYRRFEAKEFEGQYGPATDRDSIFRTYLQTETRGLGHDKLNSYLHVEWIQDLNGNDYPSFTNKLVNTWSSDGQFFHNRRHGAPAGQVYQHDTPKVKSRLDSISLTNSLIT